MVKLFEFICEIISVAHIDSTSLNYTYTTVVTFSLNLLQTPIFGGTLTVGTCFKSASVGYRLVNVLSFNFDNLNKSLLYLPSDFLGSLLKKQFCYRDCITAESAKASVFRLVPELYRRNFSPKQNILQDVLKHNLDLRKNTNQCSVIALPSESVISKKELQMECVTYVSYYTNYSNIMHVARKQIDPFEKQTLELAKQIYVASFL